MQVSYGAVAHAVLIDNDDAAILIGELLKEAWLDDVIGVYHDVIVLVKVALVEVELACSVLTGNLEDGANSLELGVAGLDVLIEYIGAEDDGVLPCWVIFLCGLAEDVAKVLLELLLRQ